MDQSLPDPGITFSSGPAKWRILPGSDELIGALKTFRFTEVASYPGLQVLKRDNSLFWGRLLAGGRDYFIKGRREDRLRRRVKSLFRASGLGAEWQKTWWLKSKGIETAEPVALGEVRRMGMLFESFLITRWMPEARNLLVYLEEKEALLSGKDFSSLRRRVVYSLGQLFGSLHALGALHRQFHDRNILVVEASDGAPRLLPIDLDHLTLRGRIREEERDWNFYQLAWHLRRPISRFKPGPADFVQFLKGYHEAAPHCASSLRALLARVSAILPPAPLLERPKPGSAPGFRTFTGG